MIYFQGVCKKFGSHVVLDDLDLHIEKGKITFILGKSGEGKSVTLKHMMGLMKPDEGRVLVDGFDISEFDEYQLRNFRKKFGMLFQHAALFDSMSVFENVLFPLREHTVLSKKAREARAKEVLELIDLLPILEKMPSELSTGEKKRVGLARALVAKPEILLYDEPTTGMDPLVCEMIDELIVKVAKMDKNLTSIVISHDLKAALESSHNIIMLYKGRVAFSGSPNDFRKTNDPVIRQFFSGRVNGPMEFM